MNDGRAGNDDEYMRLAVTLAERGRGFTSPNPVVGAVIVKNGRIIGTGWHKRYGDFHAERNALSSCAEDPSGSVMYVTLEPCCHYGKQPPCVDAIIAAKIARVVVGSNDPNPLVSGGGIKRLRDAGITVDTGVLKDECDKLNAVFFHYITTRTPFIAVKYAMTLDGKTACASGESKWITGERAREYARKLRSEYSAVAAGVQTVLADDPLLTCRIKDAHEPLRVIFDSRLRTPLDSKIVSTARAAPVAIATCSDDQSRAKLYENAGCRIIKTRSEGGRTSFSEVTEILARENIDSLFVEGGGTLCWSAIESGLVRKVYAFIGNIITGGSSPFTPVAGEGFSSLRSALRLRLQDIITLDDDLLLTATVNLGKSASS